MSLKAAIWVHGTVVEAEYPDRLQSSVRKGWGTHFVGNPGTDNWFHFPITTPVILDDQRLKLIKVFVLYNTNIPAGQVTPVFITAVHIYDGPNKVKEFNLANFAGKHDAAIDQYNSFTVNPPITIYFGLGLSMHVQFPSPPIPAVSVGHEIAFATAGADFAL